MRTTIAPLLLIASLAGVSYAREGKAQALLEKRVSLEASNWGVETVLESISKQANVRFVYSYEAIKAGRKVFMTVTDETLEAVLHKLLSSLNIDYKVSGKKTIVLSQTTEGRFTTENARRIQIPTLLSRISPEREIKGKVVDDKGDALPGVNILVKDTQRGVTTGIDGTFSLSLQEGDATLMVSFVGFVSQEVIIGNRSSLDITLLPDTRALEEVVVIGYGTVKREGFTGSVGSFRLENSPVALMPNMNALESIKGAVTGLNIGATNTAGGQPSMLIRGQNSINGSTSPLIILDGVIYLGNINDINPNDIASFDVIKDATSASAYGSRSANGVIAITTKKGKSGKPVITLNSSTGFQTWQNRPVMMAGEEWIEVVNARNKYTPGSTNWLKPGELANREAGKETVWLDEASRTGVIQNYQAAVSGSTDRVNYYMSTSYDDNKAIVVGDKYNRVSLLGKVRTNVTRWLEIGADANFSKRNYSGIPANIGEAQTMSPYGVMYRDDLGNLEKYPYTQSSINPLWGVDDDTRDNRDITNSYRLNAHALVSVPWLEGLTYRFNYQTTLSQGEIANFTNERYYIQEGEGIGRYAPSVIQGFLTQANGNRSTASTSSYVLDNILNYNRAFGEHSIDVTLVGTRDYLDYQYANTIGSNFSANGNTTLGASGLHKATVQRVDLNAYQRANIGYLGRINYSFGNRYFLTVSARRDGASVFGSNRQWATFGAAGIAWRVTNEAFMSNFRELNNLKLKFSWGQNGNQGIDPYGTLSTIANAASGGVRYQFSNAAGIINYGLFQNALGNADLGWESTQAWNAGFESAWLNNRIMLDLDVYFSKTTDQIFTRNIPVMSGFKTIKTSMGQVNNQGVEITLRTENLRGKDFSWSSMLNFWRNDNRLVKLYGEDGDGDGREDDDLANNLFIGHSLGAIFGYEQDGIVQETDVEYMQLTGAAPGSPKYKDLDGVPGITAADRRVLGYTKENFKLNLGNTFTYRNFDLYVMLIGAFGGSDRFLKANTAAYLTAGTGRFNDNMTSKPYWTPENKSNVYPSAYFAGDGRFLGLQSRSFVRVQDVSLSYRLGPAVLKALRTNAAKVFITAKNMGTFTSWFGGDPEVGTPVRENTFPVATTYAVGANLSF